MLVCPNCKNSECELERINALESTTLGHFDNNGNFHTQLNSYREPISVSIKYKCTKCCKTYNDDELVHVHEEGSWERAQLHRRNNSIQPGQHFKHFKNGRIYEIVATSVDTETHKLLVTYKWENDYCTRSFEAFMERVNGVWRFERVYA